MIAFDEAITYEAIFFSENFVLISSLLFICGLVTIAILIVTLLSSNWVIVDESEIKIIKFPIGSYRCKWSEIKKIICEYADVHVYTKAYGQAEIKFNTNFWGGGLVEEFYWVLEELEEKHGIRVGGEWSLSSGYSEDYFLV